jgi:hypothetical protein
MNPRHPLLNATAHSQDDQLARYRELGWEIEVQPRLGRCAPTMPALEVEADRVASEIPDGSCVLVGGLGYLCDALALRLLPRGCRLYAALTSRISDAEGRFVFTGPSEVVETPLSRWWRNHASGASSTIDEHSAEAPL